MTAAGHFDLICFDWDGTLFDSTAVIVRCIREAVAEVGGRPPDPQAAAFVIGMDLRSALAHAAPDVPPKRQPDLVRSYLRRYLAHQNDIALFAGVPQMLDALRGRQRLLAVATGKSRAGLDLALGSRELQGLFDASRTADETAGKPSPRMLLELMDELGVPPERTLMVGDTTHDLQMARNAACAGVGVAYGAHDRASLQARQPLYIADSVQQLQDWLLEHG